MTERGHTPGTARTEAVAAQGAARRADDLRSAAPGWPRLLAKPQAAAYLSISEWVLEQYIAAGMLRPLHPPRPSTAKAYRPRITRKNGEPSAPAGDTMRKVLFDREDLDRLVDQWKHES